jgi:hypothetical protein
VETGHTPSVQLLQPPIPLVNRACPCGVAIAHKTSPVVLINVWHWVQRGSGVRKGGGMGPKAWVSPRCCFGFGSPLCPILSHTLVGRSPRVSAHYLWPISRFPLPSVNSFNISRLLDISASPLRPPHRALGAISEVRAAIIPVIIPVTLSHQNIPVLAVSTVGQTHGRCRCPAWRAPLSKASPSVFILKIMYLK